MRTIRRIFVHCTATSQNVTVRRIQKSWRGIGWKNPGYHYIIDADGVTTQLLDESRCANGVKGYNADSIHVAYIGGIDFIRGKMKAADTRTDAQKDSLRLLLTDLKKRYPNAQILGHRDISPDKNHNGKVDPWERIKECPCFDAIPEYQYI